MFRREELIRRLQALQAGDPTEGQFEQDQPARTPVPGELRRTHGRYDLLDFGSNDSLSTPEQPRPLLLLADDSAYASVQNLLGGSLRRTGAASQLDLLGAEPSLFVPISQDPSPATSIHSTVGTLVREFGVSEGLNELGLGSTHSLSSLNQQDDQMLPIFTLRRTADQNAAQGSRFGTRNVVTEWTDPQQSPVTGRRSLRPSQSNAPEDE